jgi:hypothetical protein
MTDDMMNLRSLVEKGADADLLRERIGFAAEKLMALEVGTKTGAGYGEKNGFRLAHAMATATETGRRVRELWSCAFPSFAQAAISRVSWNRAAWLRRP